MIAYDELIGYFPEGEFIYLGAIYPTLYTCRECYSCVLSTQKEDHIRWHKGRPRAEENMLSFEIEQKARRELGRIKTDGTMS